MKYVKRLSVDSRFLLLKRECISFVKRFSYAREDMRQNSSLEKGGISTDGGEGKCVYPHIKKGCRKRVKKGKKIPLGRGHVCVELKKHLRQDASVWLFIWGKTQVRYSSSVKQSNIPPDSKSFQVSMVSSTRI